MARDDSAIHDLSQIVLFADLSRPELHEVDRVLDEEFFDEGRRVLRKGIEGSNFYVIVDGEAVVQIDGADPVRLAVGEYFGEVTLLLGEAPPGDVIAAAPLRCRVLAADKFQPFLLAHPQVLYRMLQVEAFKVARRWRD